MQHLIRVYTVCHSFSNFQTQHRVVNCTCSNFRTSMVWNRGVQILRVNTVLWVMQTEIKIKVNDYKTTNLFRIDTTIISNVLSARPFLRNFILEKGLMPLQLKHRKWCLRMSMWNLTYLSLASNKRDTGKQCRPSHKRDIGEQCRTRWDAAYCGIWSGSTLFALNT